MSSKALVTRSAAEPIDTSPRSSAISPPSIAPPNMMMPPTSVPARFAMEALGIASSRPLKPYSEVGSHPTIRRSSKASIKKRLHKSSFLRDRNSKLRKTKTLTQFSGSMQNCTTFERIKKIVSIINQDLNPFN